MSGMEILRTPESVFDRVGQLVDYPTDRRYVTVRAGDGQALRLHMVDTGAAPEADAPVLVLLHGNPAWSYIWRHQIKAAVDAGYRVIAPDHVGTGLSDKPSELGDYTVERHVEWMRAALVDELGLSNIDLVMHDWGGIIGMRLAAENPGLVNRMVISNTGLPYRDINEPMPDVIEASGTFADFQEMARLAPVWEPWSLLPMVMVTEPSDAVRHAYQAPYPESVPAIGSRAFTQLLPTRPDNPMYPANYEAWKVLDEWTKPVLTIFSDKDVVAPDGWKPIVERIPGAKGQPHVILEGGAHFLQEDIGEAYTETLMAWLGSSS